MSSLHQSNREEAAEASSEPVPRPLLIPLPVLTPYRRPSFSYPILSGPLIHTLTRPLFSRPPPFPPTIPRNPYSAESVPRLLLPLFHRLPTHLVVVWFLAAQFGAMRDLEEEQGHQGVCTEEAGGGGTDVWSSPAADHLVVMVHGILGSNADWKFGAEQFVKALPDKVIVHCSERNMRMLTLDGVDTMGERLAKEVIEVIEHWPQLRKISFIAHSVGGLVARYAIGRLYTPPEATPEGQEMGGDPKEKPRGTIHGLEAINFITVATPHLGSRGNRQVPFLFGLPALEKTASYVIHWIFRRTGRHLFLTDGDEGQTPLLQRMVTDCDDLRFMSALRAFKRRVVYSNACYDHIVGWRTSSIRRNSELPKWDDPVNEKYPHIVHEEYSKEEHAELSEEFSSDGVLDKIEEELVKGLTQVSWERVDVSFHSSRMRFASHSVIQVKDHNMHSEGADVIQHVIDRFVL